MDDDFNTAGAVAVLFDLVREANRAVASGALCATSEYFASILWTLGSRVLGFRLEMDTGGDENVTAGVVQMLIDQRNDARKTKNFAQADVIRKRLDEIGILLEDTPQGTKWRFK